jgi:hypothetical protein
MGKVDQMKFSVVAAITFMIGFELLLSGCNIDWNNIPPTPPSEGKCCGGSGA